MVKYVENKFDEDYIQTLGIKPTIKSLSAFSHLFKQVSILWKSLLF